MKEARYEELADMLEKSIDWRVEYETKHDDAGAAYSHLPREGGWSYHNGLERLKGWIESNGIEVPTGFDWDELENEVLDWCEYEPGHIFSGGTTPSKFIVDSYPVGEVEDQYCLGDLARLLETDEGETREFARLAMKDNRFCLRPNGDGGLLSYTNTDAVWIYYVDKEWVLDWIDNQTD
jgi:hypothetical protein